jgi:ABC-type multidrug transport system permease subunit
MNTLAAVGWELRRILLTRTYLYSLLLVLLISYDALNRLIIGGTYGTAPYSQVSYAQFLVLMNGFLIAILMLWCGGVFSERERAVRRIVLSTPISHAGYIAIKVAAIAGAFLLMAGLTVAASFVFYGRQFGFFAFHEFINPLAVFLLPPAVFAIGLSMAAGRLHSRLPYGLIPLVFFGGLLNLGLPLWLDVTGNTFLFNYPKILMRTFGTGEMIYYLPGSFLATRAALILAGIGLLVWAARRRYR